MGGIGTSAKRLEDPPLLMGKGLFVADINHDNQIYMRVVRSDVSHGKINLIDTELAKKLDGVLDIWSAADFDKIPKIKFRMMGRNDLENYLQPILADGKVRYVGEPIAVIFATENHIADRAAELLDINIEVMKPQISATENPLTFSGHLNNEACLVKKKYGDVDKVFKTSHNLLELEFYVGRHSGVPLETRGLSTYFDNESDTIFLHGAAKVPHANKVILCDMLDIDLKNLELIESHVGGGFGVRGEIYPEDVIIILATQKLKVPIKWLEDRKENLTATNHSRDQRHYIKVGFDNDGFIECLDVEFFTDQGAYIRTHGITVSELTASMLPGPYIIPNYRCVGHVRLTNKTPSGTYRSPGRFESTFVRERILDAVANHLNKNPLEVRFKNFIPSNLMPFKRGIDTLGTEVIFDSGDYKRLLNNALEKLNFSQLQKKLESRRKNGELVGFGFGYFIEKSGLGPFDDVKLHVNKFGKLELITGAASVGQGVETAMAQIICEKLGVGIEDITVLHGKTNLIERGMGAFATRVTVMTGSATFLAVNELYDIIIDVASKKLQQDRNDIKLNTDTGQIELIHESEGPSVDLQNILCEIYKENPHNSIEKTFENSHMTYPHGLHFAVAKIDELTLDINIERYCVFYDIGKSVNPMLIEGQIVGGVAQGIGGTLFEEFKYDDLMQPLSTSFVDYKIPTCNEIPNVECYVYQNDVATGNPLGVKGAGEAGINAVGAAVASAIDNALMSKKTFIDELPITPDKIRQKMLENV